MICLNWNVEWSQSDSPVGKIIRGICDRLDPDVMCLTETTLGMIPSAGYSIESVLDYGYPNNGSRRKVVLWSRKPWSEVDSIGKNSMPSGRFVSGLTQGIRFVGICIPWKDAHVRTGRRDRSVWEDHLAYLSGISSVVTSYLASSHPLCVLGDFNQRIPRMYQPRHVAEALSGAFGNDLVIATAGRSDHLGKPLIDHYSHTANMVVEVLEIIPNYAEDGTRLSDHVGVVASIAHSGQSDFVPPLNLSAAGLDSPCR
ncbi:endonuclease/exonuclease/phosphatase family protein [bacterium]|nr:endonuclease/exonuclease/phosphatase family protein [bacterium]